MAIHLVRHGKAGRRESWPGDDRQRPLSAAGRYQALALVSLFQGDPIARILSSPYLRCMQTVEPLGAARNLPVEAVDELAEGHDLEDLAPLLAGLAGGGGVLCSHGDVIGEVVSELVRLGLAPQDARLEKGSTWVLETKGRAIVSARYMAPPSA